MSNIDVQLPCGCSVHLVDRYPDFNNSVDHDCVKRQAEDLLKKARAKMQAADDGEAAIERSYWRGRESALLEILIEIQR